jgi:hypothetical protein
MRLQPPLSHPRSLLALSLSPLRLPPLRRYWRLRDPLVRTAPVRKCRFDPCRPCLLALTFRERVESSMAHWDQSCWM